MPERPKRVPTDAPPTVTFPPRRPGFGPVNLASLAGRHRSAAQVELGPGVVRELRGSGRKVFAEIIEPLVPDASYLADDLENALAWTTLRAATEAFLVYVRSEEATTWVRAKEDLDAVGAVLLPLAARNPQLVVELTALMGMFEARRQVALRGVSTRKGKAKGEAVNAEKGKSG